MGGFVSLLVLVPTKNVKQMKHWKDASASQSQGWKARSLGCKMLAL